MTMTFANVQNITVSQVPLERLFGISDVKVDSAGGGSGSGSHGCAGSNLHVATFRGDDIPEEIRDLMLLRLFFFLDAAPTEIYTLSLHDALPIFLWADSDHGRFIQFGALDRGQCGTHLSIARHPAAGKGPRRGGDIAADSRPCPIRERLFPLRSEEHTSELQSQSNLVCRLLLEKK